MRYRLSFTGSFGRGRTPASSETDAESCMETLAEFSGSGSGTAANEERVAKNGKNPLRSWRSVGVAALLSVMQVAQAQAGPPPGDRAPGPGQLTIVNRYHQEVPEDRARVLLLTTCRVVAEEFHRHPREVDLQVTLVVGESEERFRIETDGHLTLYLDRWNEGTFVNGVITGAVQQLTSMQIRKRMWADIVRRSDRIAPVSLNQLRGNAPTRLSPGPSLGLDCFSAARAAECPLPNRPLPHR